MFLLLLLLWIVFNGRFTLEILIFGVLIASGVSLFACRFLGYSFKREFAILRCLPDFLLYLLILVFEIIKANFVLVGLIVKGNDSISPAICHFHTKLRSNIARTILADSITLTPGTITVSLKDNELYVHCLDRKLADGITGSRFVRMLERMEGRLNGTDT